MNNYRAFRIFFSYFLNFPGLFWALFILLVIEGALAALSILSLIPLADLMINPELANPSQITQYVNKILLIISIEPSFWSFGIFFIVTNIFKGLIDILLQFVILKIKYAVLRRLISDTLNIFFGAQLSFFSEASHGKLINTLNRELSTIGDTFGHIATLLAKLVQFCIYLSIPLWLNIQLTLLAIIFALLIGLPFTLLHGYSYQLGQRNTKRANVAMEVLNEMLGAVRIIIGYGRQNHTKNRYLAAFDNLTNVTVHSQTLSAAIPRMFQPIAMAVVILAVGFALEDQKSVSESAAVMWGLFSAIPILALLIQGNVSINNFLPSYEQFIELRNNALSFKEVDGKLKFDKLKEKIEFKDVSFTYPGRPYTLKSIDLTILKGQMTALVGESGSGKSTLTDLILGLRYPSSGQVLIDGVPLNNWHKNSFRRKVGYVPQDPQLFHSSIRDNLLWSCDQATNDDIIEALRLANAENFVKELPEGIDTIVGDRGIRLSGGQRQRIALARALIRKPELLILDEATSALDTESERLIQDSIERVAKRATVLIIAHRLSTIKNADQVYVLGQGKILENGSFLNLSSLQGGILNKMMTSQLLLK